VLSAWLEQHPKVAVVARDRQGLYAQGARRGAPGDVQVADRFHLIRNLREAVERALAVQRPHLRLTAGKEVPPPPSFQKEEGRLIVVRSAVAQKEAETVRQRRQEKLELFQAVKQMQAAGMRVNEMAQHLGVNRRRLDKWVGLEELPERSRMQPRPGMAESFRDYLRHRWEQGCRHGRTLLAEIRQLGYIGGHSQLARLLSPWRQPTIENNPNSTEAPEKNSIPVPGRAISPQVAAVLLSKLPAELSSHQAEVVARLKQQCPGFAVMRKLVMGFRTILRIGKVSTLRRWMKRALKTGIHAMVRFVRTLRHDIEAVEAAVSQPWSNGPVEGQINRLKMLKRQMYGRGGTELLRARLLPDPVAA
jgi:transposase